MKIETDFKGSTYDIVEAHLFALSFYSQSFYTNDCFFCDIDVRVTTSEYYDDTKFQDLGDSFYWSKVLESPFCSVTETYSQSTVFDYDYQRICYTISVECSDENGISLQGLIFSSYSEMDLKSLQILIEYLYKLFAS